MDAPERVTGASGATTPDAPVFVVGAARSGTTLMRLMLNAHPRIAIPGETRFFVAIFERFRRGGTWPQAVNDFLEICEARLAPPVDLGEVREQLLGLPAPDLRALIDLPLRCWATAEGKRRWGEKTPDHIFYSAPIVSMFPGARFVEMVRDPRAVVASMTRSSLKSDDPTRNAMYWRYVMETAHPALHHDAGEQAVLSVRYEDLVTEPERMLREICGFLGESYDPATVAFHERSRSYMSPTRAARDPKLARPVSAELEGWRRHMDAGRLAITEHVCADAMRRLGYEPEGRPVTASERAEIAANRAYVAFKRRQDRDRYFARFTGPVAGRLRRRLGKVT